MVIGIEAERANIDNPTGVEHYAQQLILALAKNDPQNKYVLYLRTAPKAWILKLPDNFSYKLIPFAIFWTQLRISWEMLWYKPDALFIMASALPLIHPKNSVVTIHDLAWEFFPQTFKLPTRLYLKFSTWFACRFSKNIIAVSMQTKKDLLVKYNLPDEKVHVVYHGFDLSAEHQKFDSEEQQRIKDLPENYILYLGTLQPRKNIIGLIDAYIQLCREGKISNPLVIAGGKGWLYEQIMQKIAAHPEIIYFGYVKDRFALLRRAALLVQPAFYEGFGLQILDAFASNVPVACSNVSSLPEVAGDAAEYFDPNQVQEIKAAIYKVLNDSNFADALREKGSVRLKEFTWQKCAAETLAVLENR